MINAVQVSGPKWAKKTYLITVDGVGMATLALVPLNMIQRRAYVGIEIHEPAREQSFRLLRGLATHVRGFFAGWEIEAYVTAGNEKFAEFFGLRSIGPGPFETTLYRRQF